MKKRRALFASLTLAGLSMEELYRYIFCRHQGSLSFADFKHHSEDYYERRDRYADDFGKLPFTEYTLKGERGRTLVGHYICAGEKPSGRIAFLIHGYRADSAEAAGPFYEYYFSKGWDVFVCDHASHGLSEGEIISYDYYESLDCLKWLDFLKENYGEDIQIILHGFSMGGAIVVKMSDRVPENVKFICDDCGFSDAVGIIKPKLKVLYPVVRLLNRGVGRFRLEDTDVRENLSHAKVPILFVHGTADPTVPFEMGKELYELCPTEKDCLFSEGILHVESIYRRREEYEKKLDSFIDKYTKRG
ncbi:MAG: alpha/beta hydrolase [Eubacteriales bacterium]|nr:alpha/beta hydrolase [Eubacteriales bacterium]